MTPHNCSSISRSPYSTVNITKALLLLQYTYWRQDPRVHRASLNLSLDYTANVLAPMDIFDSHYVHNMISYGSGEDPARRHRSTWAFCDDLGAVMRFVLQAGMTCLFEGRQYCDVDKLQIASYFYTMRAMEVSFVFRGVGGQDKAIIHDAGFRAAALVGVPFILLYFVLDIMVLRRIVKNSGSKGSASVSMMTILLFVST